MSPWLLSETSLLLGGGGLCGGSERLQAHPRTLAHHAFAKEAQAPSNEPQTWNHYSIIARGVALEDMPDLLSSPVLRTLGSSQSHPRTSSPSPLVGAGAESCVGEGCRLHLSLASELTHVISCNLKSKPDLIYYTPPSSISLHGAAV